MTYPYRFKTNKELTLEFGDDWIYRNPFPGIGWNEHMNNLLGKDYPYYITDEFFKDFDNNPYYFERVDNEHGSWHIHQKMLTKKDKRPSYKPRKIIRESRQFFEIIHVRVDNYEDALVFQNYLQDNGFTWHGDGRINIIQKFEDEPVYLFNINIKEKNIINATFRFDISRYDKELLFFYPKDLNKVKSIIIENRIRPSYKPKKFLRESLSYGTIYDALFFRMNNKSEFSLSKNILEEKDYSIQPSDINLLNNINDDDFPLYLIVEWKNKIFTISQWEWDWDDNDVIDYINQYNNSVVDTNISNKIYSFKDVKNVNYLFKGIKVPSYEPRKINKFS